MPACVRALADDLDIQRRAIVETVTGADPTEALDLLWRFMALAPSVFERCDEDRQLWFLRSERAPAGHRGARTGV